MRRLRLLTWHVHGSYLYYLSRIPHDIFLPVLPGGGFGYGGRTPSFPWPDNVHAVPAGSVKELDLDAVIFQSLVHYQKDQHEILSERQRRLPRIFVEHDPPRAHPTDTLHPVQDPSVTLVHVTHFNALMWDSGVTPSQVIEHGVAIPEGVVYRGDKGRGIVAINHLARRGRRLGADLVAFWRQHVPLDIVGMGWEETPGGIAEIAPCALARFMAEYRFYLSPIRYTSLGLATIEAMQAGVPVVGLATAELATVLTPDVTGFVATSPEALLEPMTRLLHDHDLARRVGAAGRSYALRRFGIERFVADWCRLLQGVTPRRRAPLPYTAQAKET